MPAAGDVLTPSLTAFRRGRERDEHGRHEHRHAPHHQLDDLLRAPRTLPTFRSGRPRGATSPAVAACFCHSDLCTRVAVSRSDAVSGLTRPCAMQAHPAAKNPNTARKCERFPEHALRQVAHKHVWRQSDSGQFSQLLCWIETDPRDSHPLKTRVKLNQDCHECSAELLQQEPARNEGLSRLRSPSDIHTVESCAKRQPVPKSLNSFSKRPQVAADA